MALDEFLFAKVSNYFKGLQQKKRDEEDRVVQLSDIKEKLTIMGRAVTGEAIDIFISEREGGYKNNAFFLPSRCSLFTLKESNYNFYLFRLLYLSVQKKLRINHEWLHEIGTAEAQQKAKESAPRVLQVLFDEFPLTRTWHHHFLEQLEQVRDKNATADTTWLYGKWMMQTVDSEGTQKGDIPSPGTVLPGKNAGTTLKARAVEEIKSIEVDKKQQEDYVLTHNFEKVDTADEFDGVWRDFDGDDDLKDHEKALEELRMKFTVRTDDMAHSVYQADFIENAIVSESRDLKAQDHFIYYDEWDCTKGRYKEQFCKVFPVARSEADSAYYTNTIRKNAVILNGLRKMLANVNNKQLQQVRQTQGNAFDLDAITDLYTDVHSGHTPSEKIYIANRKKEKDLSILLLLDLSLSSDAYAKGNRVIDVEKEVAILFGEIMNEFGIDFAITGFYSRTRNHTTYTMLKDFDETWNQSKFKIGAAEPQGYTRIGAALRHSGALMAQRQTKNKWVILISDGKPNDFDRYEGRYGIQDVKQALMELNKKHIHSYALAIEAEAKYYLPQMFGQNHYQILTSPAALLHSLLALYEKIRYQS